jgi:hypothetical protein
MKNRLIAFLTSLYLALSSTHVFANDLEGQIESINQTERSFIVQGIRFFTTQSTDYDDGLKRFSDLEVGQQVEVDFEYRDQKHYATEIELDD